MGAMCGNPARDGGRADHEGDGDTIGDSIEEGLPHIPLKCCFVARLEEPDPAGDLGERILHQIFGVDRLPRPGRQAAVRRAPQARQVAGAQPVQRRPVPGSGAEDEREGRLRVRYPGAPSTRILVRRRLTSVWRLFPHGD